MKNSIVHYHELVIVTVIVESRCPSRFRTKMNGIVQCMQFLTPIHDHHRWNDGFANVLWNDEQAMK